MPKNGAVRKIFLPAVIVVSSLWAVPAYATDFTLATYTVSTNAGNGLEVWADQILGPNYTFGLSAEGDSKTVGLFQLGTSEGYINQGEDTVAKPISVGFSFSAPSPGFVGTSYGSTDSDSIFFGLIGWGFVDWANPLVLSFGSSGKLGIWLENATFAAPGSTVIDATFKLLSADRTVTAALTPVPEPATLVLFGSGLAAGAAFLRRRMRKT